MKKISEEKVRRSLEVIRLICLVASIQQAKGQPEEDFGSPTKEEVLWLLVGLSLIGAFTILVAICSLLRWMSKPTARKEMTKIDEEDEKEEEEEVKTWKKEEGEVPTTKEVSKKPQEAGSSSSMGIRQRNRNGPSVFVTKFGKKFHIRTTCPTLNESRLIESMKCPLCYKGESLYERTLYVKGPGQMAHLSSKCTDCDGTENSYPICFRCTEG